MTKQEMLEKVQGMQELKGVNIWADKRPDRPIIEIENVRKAACGAAKAYELLKVLGFSAAFGSARWVGEDDTPSIRENYEKMTPEQKKAADKLFNDMATGR
jgi:hypothetical protein